MDSFFLINEVSHKMFYLNEQIQSSLAFQLDQFAFMYVVYTKKKNSVSYACGWKVNECFIYVLNKRLSE